MVALEDFSSPHPIVRIFDSGGKLTSVIPVTIPESDWIGVRGAAHGLNGVTAICGYAKDRNAHAAGFIALALNSNDGTLQRVIRTEPYWPSAVTIAPDGSIWTKGAEFEGFKQTYSKTDNGILRHFDPSGRVIGSFLPQSTLSRGEMFRGIDQMASNARRVGWYVGRGAKAYFEVVKDRLETYPPLAQDESRHEQISGLAITGDGHVFITKSDGSASRLYVLNRESRTWDPVVPPEGGSPPATGWLMGGSGNNIVLRTTEPSRLRRFAVGKGDAR